jgi:hypothetical protein
MKQSAEKLKRFREEGCQFGRAVILLPRLFVIGLVFSMGLSLPAEAGQVVDRMVANVNGHMLLQSDWEQEVAFEALSNGRDPDSFTTAERQAALDRLIDQELLREQVRPAQPAPADQVAARLAEVRDEAGKLCSNCATEQSWQATLQRYGLTQKELEKRLSDQIQLMKLVEDRLRPSIHVDEQAVEAYYREQLLPKMKQAGTRATPLTEVFGRIKDLLAQQKMNELLSGWLANLRSGSHLPAPQPSPGERNP